MPVPSDRAVPIPLDFPPVVYVPCAEHVQELSRARPAIRNMKDGRAALLAYSALDRFKYCCGSAQPWILLSFEALESLRIAQGFDVILLDVVIPEQHRMVD